MVFQAMSRSLRDTLSPTNRGSVSTPRLISLSYSILRPDLESQWGMRIESALVVRKVRVSHCSPRLREERG